MIDAKESNGRDTVFMSKNNASINYQTIAKPVSEIQAPHRVHVDAYQSRNSPGNNANMSDNTKRDSIVVTRVDHGISV